MANITLKNGMLFETGTEAARHYGLDPTLVNERVSKHGWTIDQALNMDVPPNAPHRKAIEIEGAYYESINEAGRSLGMSVSTLRNRLDAGYYNTVDVPSQRISLKKLKAVVCS